MREHRVDAVIIAEQGDLHSRAVQREISLRGGSCLIFDTLSFTADVTLTCRLDGGAAAMTLKPHNRNVRWSIDNETSVWWRRPRGYTTGDMFRHPRAQAFASRQCSLAFLGSLSQCCRRVINPVVTHYPTTKLYELRVAADVGFEIPDTLVTTDVDEAKRVVATADRQYVYKIFRGEASLGAYETRLFESEDDIHELWRIRHCPMIIQEYVPATADLRVTVVADQVFCASSQVNAGSTCIDGRVDRTPARPHALKPPEIEKLLALSRSLGLVYAAIDLRLKENGEIVFLEVNPQGQYLWLEVEAGLPISAAVARLLFPDTVTAREGRSIFAAQDNAARP